ncbi:MAG: hypothetical protein JJ850_08735 [Kordiimonadaceae bacterium]|nr:hypothetical protein [Kordiimonadaceae bacterium]MBO6569213.1 hypothetical protein [Kordiimonadaceae bacterium]MBO6964689.1 hypothetical protein [Kordiimonadaceae bacterium]
MFFRRSIQDSKTWANESLRNLNSGRCAGAYAAQFLLRDGETGMQKQIDGDCNIREQFSADYVRSLLPQDFFESSFQTEFRKIEQAVCQAPLQQLLTLEKLDQMLAAQSLVGQQVGAVVNGTVGPRHAARTKAGILDCIGLRKQMVSGTSIRLDAIETYDPVIRQMCAALETVFGCRSSANVYVTPPDNKAFKPHFDLHDVLVLQCIGTKSWSFYPQYEDSIELPNFRNEFIPEKHKPIGTEKSEFTMSEGDLLYIPRGAMHDARCESDFSCHVTFALHTSTWMDYFEAALSILNDDDVDFRRRAGPQPLSEMRAHETPNVIAELASRIGALDPAIVERQMFDSIVSGRGTVCGGMVSSALKKQVNPELSGIDYSVSLVANATMRLFQEEEKKWHLWSAEHSTQISDTEAKLLKRLQAGEALSSLSIRQSHGETTGDTFVKTLMMLGLINLAKTEHVPSANNVVRGKVNMSPDRSQEQERQTA